MFKKKILLLWVLIFILTTFSACQTYDNFVAAFITHKSEERSTIRIGVYEPLTGDKKAYGELEKMGIELAHEVYPTIMGKEVELVYVDNQADIDTGKTVARDLVEKKVSIVLGSYGSVNSLVAAPILEEAKIPAIAITNTNPLVTKSNPYYSRICFVESFQGVALAKYAVEQMHITEAGVLFPRGDDRAIAVTKAFSDKYIQLGGTISLSVEFTSGAEDYTQQLKRFKDQDVRVIFVPANIRDSALIIHQAKNVGLNCIFLGTDDWEEDDFLYQVAAAGTNVIAFSSLFDAQAGTKETDTFLRAFRLKYGYDAVPERATVLGYDAYIMARSALIRAGTVVRGELIMEQLLKHRDFEGASGLISFDEIGDPIKSVAIKTVRDKKFTTIYTVVPKWG